MGGSLAGVRVGVLQARHARDFSALLEREGAAVVLAPCLREVRGDGDDGLAAALRDVTSRPPDLFVFQTGVGTRALFDLAARAGLDGPLAAAARGARVLARGPKPLAALHALGLRADLRTAEPHTTNEVRALLDGEDLAGRRVALQHYGSPNEALVGYLRDRGADVVELFSYRWALPEDVGPVHRLLAELAAGRLTATVFTSASQVENLFAVAADAGHGPELAGWLNERTVTAAIGPTCAGALEERGVAVRLTPDRPKMVPLVRALGAHLAR
jgi:uroporphyrinogen-III synthase